MVHNVKNKIQLLDEECFSRAALWRFDSEGDDYFPVNTPDELPKDIGDLRIKAKFIALSGVEFDGYVVGFESEPFSIAIFSKGRMYHFNKQVPASLIQHQLSGLLEACSSSGMSSNDDLFPIRYVTQFDWSDLGYNNFEGLFNPFDRSD